MPEFEQRVQDAMARIVTAGYRQLSLEHHPDRRQPTMGEAPTDEEMKALNVAAERLRAGDLPRASAAGRSEKPAGGQYELMLTRANLAHLIGGGQLTWTWPEDGLFLTATLDAGESPATWTFLDALGTILEGFAGDKTRARRAPKYGRRR